MAGIFDFIPTLVPILFIISMIGVIVYERSKTNPTDKSDS